MNELPDISNLPVDPELQKLSAKIFEHYVKPKLIGVSWIITKQPMNVDKMSNIIDNNRKRIIKKDK